MRAQCLVCLVLLSAAAVCTASGASSTAQQANTSRGSSSAQLTSSGKPRQQLPTASNKQAPPTAATARDRENVPKKNSSSVLAPVANATAAARQQAAQKPAGNATAPAPIPAEPRPESEAAASSRHRTGNAGSGRVARNLRNRRLGMSAARRAGSMRVAGRQLGQHRHARPLLQKDINEAAVGTGVRNLAVNAPAGPSTGSSKMTTTTITAAATPAARQRLSREPDSSKLQAQKYFTITDLTGSKAIEIGTTLTWREGQLLRPAADSASGPSDWKLVKVEAKAPVVSNKKSDSSSVASWVTTCGYLQWLKSSREVKYTAEVDGCSEVINYAARRRDDPDYPTQFGLLLITVAVDNCVYSHCEQAGCGSTCKCISKQTGECSCGDSSVTGFAPYYSWPQNRQSCAYNNISVVADSGSSNSGSGNAGSSEEALVVFEAKRGSGKIAIPIRFGNTPNCLQPLASRRLQVHSVKCTKTSSEADDKRPAVPAKQATATAQAGSLQGGCNRVDGTYLVVVGVPSAVGQYRCSVTLNDDWEDRPLAELRVK